MVGVGQCIKSNLPIIEKDTCYVFEFLLFFFQSVECLLVFNLVVVSLEYNEIFSLVTPSLDKVQHPDYYENICHLILLDVYDKLSRR